MAGAEDTPYGKRACIPEQPLVSINHHILTGLFLQTNLLVRLTQVKLCEGLTSGKTRKQVFNLWNGVVIQF